jgi:hypothetical protein
MSLSACGGSSGGLGSGVAVRIGDRTISEATVAHWTPIEAILSKEVFPSKPVPKGMAPDPPDYTDCIAYLKGKAAGEAVVSPKPTAAQLKQECRKDEVSSRQHILDILILYHWLLGEAERKGLTVTDQEAMESLKAHERTQFTSSDAFHRYLAYTGLTMSDELLRFKNNLLAAKILNHVIEREGATPQQRRHNYTKFLKYWINKTDCAPGYIVPDCRQYKGPLPPGS